MVLRREEESSARAVVVEVVVVGMEGMVEISGMAEVDPPVKRELKKEGSWALVVREAEKDWAVGEVGFAVEVVMEIDSLVNQEMENLVHSGMAAVDSPAKEEAEKVVGVGVTSGGSPSKEEVEKVGDVGVMLGGSLGKEEVEKVECMGLAVGGSPGSGKGAEQEEKEGVLAVAESLEAEEEGTAVADSQ